MNVADAITRRRSIRAFLPTPVDEAVIRAALDAARMAPSSLNLQPWSAVVVAGEPLRALSAAMQAAPFQHPEEYEELSPDTPQRYLDRRNAAGAARFAALGIARGDTAARTAAQDRNYRFFDAPACLFAFVPRHMSVGKWASAGLWLQSVMLLLTEAGLGSCPQESLAHHARLIKARLGIDDAEHLLWCGLAIGHADPAAPVNRYDRPRAPLAEQARFVGFDVG